MIVSASIFLTLFAASAHTTSIPFTLRDNLVRVHAVIDGKAVSAVLDSGSSTILVDRAKSPKAAQKASGEALGGGANASPFFPVKFESLDFASIHLRQADGVAIDLSPFSKSAGFPVDVLLGEPVLRAAPIRIDYPARRITLLPKGRSISCRRPIAFDIVNNVPVVTVLLRSDDHDPGERLRLIVDLGTRHFPAIVGGPFLESSAGKALMSSGTLEQIGTGTGGSVAGVRSQTYDLQVGQNHYRHLAIAMTDQVRAFKAGFADGSLGAPLWKNGAISFDYSNHVMCLPEAKP